jgi:CheY-like chemotaxis protein
VSATITPLRSRSRLTILIVDRDPVSRLRLSEELRGAGYRVLEANAGPEAQEVLIERPVHLLVLNSDLDGPVDALALMRMAEGLRPPSKVIATRIDPRHGSAEVRSDPAAPSCLITLVRESLDPTGTGL